MFGSRTGPLISGCVSPPGTVGAPGTGVAVGGLCGAPGGAVGFCCTGAGGAVGFVGVDEPGITGWPGGAVGLFGCGVGCGLCGVCAKAALVPNHRALASTTVPNNVLDIRVNIKRQAP